MEKNNEKTKFLEIKRNDNFMKNKTIRNHEIDFIRSLAMYGIIINHIITKNKIYFKYKKFKELGFLNTLVFWHNNGFSFISGFIGYKTNKYSNLFYLWICVFFYSVIIYFFYVYYKPQVINDKFYNNLFPIIFGRYWFFSSYFGMYLFLPIINKGIAYLNKNEFTICLISIIYIFVVWHDIMNLNYDVFRTNKGYSVLWLLIFYITGAYFGKNKIILFGKKKLCFCLTNFLIYIFLSFLFYKINYCQINNLEGNYKFKYIIKLRKLLSRNFDSNFKVIQSISIIFCLLQLKFNEYFGKIISFIGTLTFGVYLIHHNNYVKNDIMVNLFNNEKNNLSLLSVYKLFLTKSLLVFILCIIIDYLRNFLFNLLQIRKMCILLETKIFEIFNIFIH